MADSFSIALSGIKAAETRLANATNNIVNSQSTGFKPTDVVQSSLASGGVRADVVERSPEAQFLADGETPNVSLEQEVVETITASYDLKANLRLIKTQKEIDEALLDIQA